MISWYIAWLADPGVYTVQGVGLQPFDCWDRSFESRWVHGCSSAVFVVGCVGDGASEVAVTPLEDSYRASRARVCLCVI